MTAEAPEPSNADLLAFMQQAFAHLTTEIAGVRADVADAKDELRGEIRATEAGLISRLDAVQQVVRSVKSDISAHVDDRDTHHRHAA
jgi:hypothetical protein